MTTKGMQLTEQISTTLGKSPALLYNVHRPLEHAVMLSAGGDLSQIRSIRGRTKCVRIHKAGNR